MAIRFIKYKIRIDKIEEFDGTSKHYNKLSESGNKTDNGPTYGYVEIDSIGTRETELLRMESQDDKLDLKRIIAAILGMPV